MPSPKIIIKLLHNNITNKPLHNHLYLHLVSYSMYAFKNDVRNRLDKDTLSPFIKRMTFIWISSILLIFTIKDLWLWKNIPPERPLTHSVLFCLRYIISVCLWVCLIYGLYCCYLLGLLQADVFLIILTNWTTVYILRGLFICLRILQ